MKRNTKRYIAAVLAAVMLFTDCTAGFAAEADAGSIVDVEAELQDELELLKVGEEPVLTESMIEEFSAEPDEEETPHVLFELEDMRAQDGKKYRLSDGSVLAAQYGMDIHYQDEGGEWAEIDNRFLYEEAETTEDFNGYITAEGAVEYKFAPQVQDGEIFRITQDDYSVGFEMLPSEMEEIQTEPQETEAVAEAISEEAIEETTTTEPATVPISFLKGEILNTEEIPSELAAVPAALSAEEPEVLWADITDAVPEAEEAEFLDSVRMDKAVTSVGYGNVLPGVSLQYVLAGSSLKEYILVNQKQETYSYDFAMNLGNLEPEMQEDGSILLKDTEDGTAIYEIPAGYMTDAAGEQSDAVEMEITEAEEGSCILTVTADAEWINAEERVLPVRIDPTMNYLLDSLTDIRGSYVAEGYPTTSNVQYGNLMVGYDSSGSKQLRTYIQLRNLPILPKDSVVCGAVCYFDVVNFSHVGHSTMNIRAKELIGENTWTDTFTWETKPEISSTIMDHKAVNESSVGTYVGWNITELVKDHYQAGNASGSISAFALEAYGGTSMGNTNCAKTTLRLTRTTTYPVLHIMYRDTKGIEEYYTYQTHDIGNAGIAYVGDYNSQLTLVKPVLAYDSTIMSYDVGLVYNSAYSDRYFTNDGENIHSKDFTTTNLGLGWKLSAQETVTTVTLADMDGEAVWLVYNDSDGTEHYFKQSEEDASRYEDEDGLNLTITKSGSDFTMTDAEDNQKFFKNGYLTKLTDANGNAIHIVYNGGTASSNTISSSGANRITSVCSQPKGGSAETIFTLTYDSNDLLAYMGEKQGNFYKLEYTTDQNGHYQLRKISSYDAETGTYPENARYGYDSVHGSLKYVIDADADTGMFYEYEKSLTGYRICYFHEYAAESSTNIGNKVSINSDELRKTVYRDYGADRTINTADDILTTYLFNSFGQTVNVSSSDQDGNLLGVTAAAYEANSGTSKKNNRISQSIAAGQTGVNLLPNGGFEKYTGTTADGWNHTVSGGTVSCVTTAPRSGEACYELYSGDTSKVQSVYQSANLEAGKTYTASVYVNTSAASSFENGGGAYLRVLDQENSEVAKGNILQYRTNTEIDGGWQRISVTFTPVVSAIYRIHLLWRYAQGTLRADDAQLEIGEAPSSFNHVYNGSFENGEDGWTVSDVNDFVDSGTVNHGEKSYRMNGYPDTVLYAEQQIPMNKSSDTTFLLSGWSKGTSIPELESICDELTDKFWGITVKLHYDDGTSEKHHLPFNEYVQEWQYAAMAVVPKASGKTIRYAEVRVCYFNNANEAYFDNISLTEEPAQTYLYDDEGNVTSVKSTGNGEETYSYDEDTQNLISVDTEDSGTYTFEYADTENEHLPTSITNDTMTADITYDDYGQSTEIAQTDSTEGWKLTGSTAYSNGLLTSETDDTGAETKYTYTDRRQVAAVENANGQVVNSHYDYSYGRLNNVYQSGKASVAYDYANGNLSKITRGGYITSGGTKQNQTYSFAYDLFGKLTGVSVGENPLTGYSYNSGNGNLKSMTYGPTDAPLATISYDYDNLDRVKTVTYHDSNSGQEKTYGYRYSADGNIAGVTENGELRYTYEYDSLGRLIYSSQLENGKTVLYTKHQYDTSDRITAQSWQIGNEAFSESYTYDEDDGTLKGMNIGTEAIAFTYNGLKQLAKRTSPKVDTAYEYRVLDAEEKAVTSQIASMQYLKAGTTEELLPTLSYTYDALGNITRLQSGTATAAEYTYDAQNQVTKEVLPSQTSEYVYDTYGNIRSKTITDSETASESYTFSYEDTEWLDKLTKVTYTDKNGNTTSQSLTYDAIGNPLSYFNGKNSWTFIWKYGRELASATDGSTNITYTYNENGIRESKTVDGVEHNYITLDDKVIRETYGTTTLDYLYDEQGRAYKLIIDENGTTYTGYFVLNQQGDTIALLDEAGAVAVQYEYDAWGKEIGHSTTGTAGSKLYEYNAIKYRGYYYDAELEMYYLGSRYYDAEFGRFINADSTDVLGVQDDFSDLNLYAYCNNNPVNSMDVGGYFTLTFTTAMVAVVLTISAYSMYLSIKRAIKRGNGLKSLLRIFPRISIQRVTVRRSGQNIPNRLIDKKTGNVDLGKFRTKVKGKTAYKESGGWIIDKDETGHKGKWKLKDKKGERVGTLDEKGRVLGK